VITSVRLERFRGIREGTLDGLAPLTVLVGPNGSGKSSILDALLIAGSANPADAIGRSVKRRAAAEPAAAWLFHRMTQTSSIVVTTDEETRTIYLQWRDDVFTRLLTASPGRLPFPSTSGAVEANLVVRKHNTTTPVETRHWVAFSDTNEFQTNGPNGLTGGEPAPGVELVDLRGAALGAEPLHDILSRALRRGAKKPVIELLKEVLPPDFEDLQVATEKSIPSVHLVTRSGSVPVSHAGDGIRGLVRVALALGAQESGVALVEEPEVHQHPAALRQTARALVAAARRGIQTIVATHSLELIDEMIAEASQKEFTDSLAVLRLSLTDGVLSSVATRGAQLLSARTQVEVELR
jgi:predicted ATPase